MRNRNLYATLQNSSSDGGYLVLGHSVDNLLQLAGGLREELLLAHDAGDDQLVHELVVLALSLHDVRLGLLVHVRVLLQPALHLLAELVDLGCQFHACGCIALAGSLHIRNERNTKHFIRNIKGS